MKALAVTAAVAFSWASAGAALASGPSQGGVHVDPGSPAGHEYVIPITAARSETAGGTHGGGSGAGVGSGAAGGGSAGGAPLFGVGVTPGASGAVAVSSAKVPQHAGSAARRRGGASPGAKNTKYVSLSGLSTPSNASSGTGWIALAGGGVLVLLVGGGAGLALRRRLSQT